VHIVRQRTRVKNQVQAVLARNLLPRCPASDLFGQKGRRWLASQPLPPDEAVTVAALLRLLDAALAEEALQRPDVLRLMTIPGVDMAVAVALVATVGDFSRFSSPNKLVSYFGLNPKVRQSGGLPAVHGHISK
jgi:transposase